MTVKSTIPVFRLLNDEQIQQIYQATLKVLENTGIKVQYDKVRQLLVKAGTKDVGSKIVHLGESFM